MQAVLHGALADLVQRGRPLSPPFSVSGKTGQPSTSNITRFVSIPPSSTSLKKPARVSMPLISGSSMAAAMLSNSVVWVEVSPPISCTVLESASLRRSASSWSLVKVAAFLLRWRLRRNIRRPINSARMNMPAEVLTIAAIEIPPFQESRVLCLFIRMGLMFDLNPAAAGTAS
jgi:hypothetical protein